MKFVAVLGQPDLIRNKDTGFIYSMNDPGGRGLLKAQAIADLGKDADPALLIVYEKLLKLEIAVASLSR